MVVNSECCGHTGESLSDAGTGCALKEALQFYSYDR